MCFTHPHLIIFLKKGKKVCGSRGEKPERKAQKEEAATIMIKSKNAVQNYRPRSQALAYSILCFLKYFSKTKGPGIFVMLVLRLESCLLWPHLKFRRRR